MVQIIDLHFQGQTETVAAFLVETGAGPVLVETGPHSTLPRLESALAAAGYALEDIRHVFLTHIHLDHAGAAWAFARHGATIYVHPRGEPHLANPEKLLASAKMIYKDQMQSLWGDLQPIPKEQLRTVGHREKIMLGKTWLKGWHTPGHAVHHVAWQWGDSMFTGDVAGIRIGGSIVMPPCPPPDIHLEDWKKSLKMIRREHFKRIYLTHFGEVTDVKYHIIELTGKLVNWENWLEPYLAEDMNPVLLEPLFQAYVRKQLEDAGLHGDSLEKYEMANPSRMSFAGLMRYLKKKGEQQVQGGSI